MTILFTVYRMTWSADSSSQVLTSTFLGHLQQANANVTIGLADSITVSHTIWCGTSSNVEKGDRITDGNYYYSVRAIIEYNTGDNSHLELFIEREEEYASV